MILRHLPVLAIVAAVSLAAGAAHASGDFSCATTWKLTNSVYDECNNVPFLSPGNDSRVNLTLLLVDAGKAQLGPVPPTDPPTPPIDSSAAPFTLEAFAPLIGPKPPGAPSDAASSDDYASGEGSRCRSNATGEAAFEAALAASALVPQAERPILVTARQALSPGCDSSGSPAAYPVLDGVRSTVGRQFAHYLAGAAEFYDGDFGDARKDFAQAAASPQPWLKETSRYMLARVALNAAQANAFEDYGALSPAKVDAAALKDADAGFRAYLAAYPSGAYAVSARGLLRRVAWLGGQPQALTAAYAAAFAHAGPSDSNVGVSDLVFEADDKLLTQVAPADLPDPMLLATRDLMAMRRDPKNSKPDPSLIAFDDLAAQRPSFAAAPELYEYLLAAHRFYVESDPAGALTHLTATAPSAPMNDLAFSQFALRGFALEAEHNYADARALWLQMRPLARPAFQRPMLDLALAMNEERDGRLAQVFAAGSPVHDPQVREVLLRNDAGPALLAQQVRNAAVPDRERRTARYVLLYKDVMRGRYAAYAADSALSAPEAEASPSSGDQTNAEPDPKLFDWAGHSEGYICEDLEELVSALARAPSAPHNLLCLGDFARLNLLDGNALNTSAPADELGGAPTQFPGRTFARLDAYRRLIADPKTPPAERAYALYRAINCYAPAGANECDGVGVPQSERAKWFHTLKSEYAGSEWARALKYYW